VNFSIHCIWFGALGGIIISLKGVYDHAFGRDPWNDSFNLWHLGWPVSGGIAGLMTFLLLALVSSNVPSEPVAYAAAFIFGTQERRFFRPLSEVARLIVQVPSETTQQPLTIANISPDHGPAGTPIRIIGTGFDPKATATLSGAPIENVVVRDGTSISGVAPKKPAGVDKADLMVTNPDGATSRKRRLSVSPNSSPDIRSVQESAFSGRISTLAEPGMGDPVAGRNPELARGPRNDLEHAARRRAGGNDVVGFGFGVLGDAQYAAVAADEDHVERNVGVVHPHLDDLIGLELEQHALSFGQRPAEHQPARALFVAHGEFHRENVHAGLADDFEGIVGRANRRPADGENQRDQQGNQKGTPKLLHPPYATRQ
jgi:hypothetical protein